MGGGGGMGGFPGGFPAGGFSSFSSGGGMPQMNMNMGGGGRGGGFTPSDPNDIFASVSFSPTSSFKRVILKTSFFLNFNF